MDKGFRTRGPDKVLIGEKVSLKEPSNITRPWSSQKQGAPGCPVMSHTLDNLASTRETLTAFDGEGGEAPKARAESKAIAARDDIAYFGAVISDLQGQS